jgi:hypothetical protein
MIKSNQFRCVLIIGLLSSFLFASELPAEISETTMNDELLRMIPAESLFCIRANNLNQTLVQIDQFLTGVAPMNVSMLFRAQFATLLGSQELNGVNMNGSFAIFGPISDSEMKGPDDIGILVPVTGYEQFISANPNCAEPDEKGVSKITLDATSSVLVAQVANYALINPGGNYEGLVAAIQSISQSSTAGLASILDADEAKCAVTEPIWAYGNVQLASEVFGPVISNKLEEIKKIMEQNKEKSQMPMASPAAIMNMYASILETLMKEIKSLSVTVNPKPDVLNIVSTASSVPGTDMSDIFAAGDTATRENKLLGYLKDGAMMNFTCRLDAPFWEKLYIKTIDMFSSIADMNIPADEIAKWKTLTNDAFNALGDQMVCSVSIDTKNKPPFVGNYVLTVKDAEKLNKLIEESVQMMNTGFIADFYKKFLSMETIFSVKRNLDQYKDIPIDSAKFVMKPTEPNSPQAQMINMMYGEGFDYRWAMVDGLCVYAVGGDADSTVRQMIDEVKAGGPSQIASEMQAALALLPEANKADFVGTFNYLRMFQMVFAMMPMPMPPVDIPTKSNIAMAAKAGQGKITFNIAVPKEHLMEIVTVFQKMQQQQMQMQQQKMMQKTQEQPAM